MGFSDLPEHKQNAIIMMVTGDPQQPFKRMKYKDIADALGIAEFTLRRWRADPEFQEARKEYRNKYVKEDVIDEAARTIFRAMRTKDSTHAAEVALKWAGEMIERRSVEGNINHTQQIDIKNGTHAELLAKLRDLSEQLGLPIDDEHLLTISSMPIVEGEIVDDESDDDDEKDE